MAARPQDGSVAAGARRWRWVRVGLCASIVVVLAELALAGMRPGRVQLSPAVGVFFSVYIAAGIAFAIRAWRHQHLDPHSRRAWGLVAVAYGLLMVSSYLRPVYPLGIGFPSPADLLRLLFVPVLLAGLLALPLRAQGRHERHKIWLDTAVVVVASAMLLWFLQGAATVGAAPHISAGALAAAIAYPASDLVLIFGAVVVLLRGGAESARRPAILLGAAMLLLVAGDLSLGYQLSRGVEAHPDGWQWACWMTAHFLLALAPAVQCERASRHELRTEQARARLVSNLPYLAIGVGYTLLLWSVVGLPVRVVGLVLGAFAMTAVVVVRQVVAMRENHELAITDVLTGLFNRRRFYDALQGALARSVRNGQSVAVLLIDLNGFKQVNDTIGHKAGDQLLVGFGRMLRRNVLGLDAVGRLGGDEFAVVLHNVGAAETTAVVQRIVAEMQTPILAGDTPVVPRASIGIALSGPGQQLTAEEILHRADRAMYQAKAATRQTGTTSFAHHQESADQEVVHVLAGGTPPD